MKTICLIKDDRALWETIAGRLIAVNAQVFSVSEGSALNDLRGQAPDLIIAGQRAYTVISAISQNVPKIIIKEDTGPITVQGKAKDTYFLSWPMDKEAFLEITARLLYISERRVFNALIGIALKNKKESFIGRSENFSMTGIAFTTDAGLMLGDTVTIFFYVTGIGIRIGLEAEIVRKAVDPATGRPYYGARFINLSPENKDILSRFIAKA